MPARSRRIANRRTSTSMAGSYDVAGVLSAAAPRPKAAARSRPGSPAAMRAVGAGITASASAPSIEVSTCEPWLLGRRRVPAVVAELEPAADQRGRGPGASRSSASRIAVARRRPASARRASRRIAGRTKSRKVTIAETGLPGSPKTSGRPRRDAGPRSRSACPGRRATPQKTCSTPSVCERRAHVVVLADRDAAGDDREVGVERPARAPPRVASGVVARRSRRWRPRRPARSTSPASA